MRVRSGRRPRSIVPLERHHLLAGVISGLSAAIVLTIVDAVQNGFGLRDLVFDAVFGIALIAAMSWASWRDDNRLERGLRGERRSHRPRGPAKTR